MSHAAQIQKGPFLGFLTSLISGARSGAGASGPRGCRAGNADKNVVVPAPLLDRNG